MYKITVFNKQGIFDAVGSGVKKDIYDLGINSVEDVSTFQIYVLEGGLNKFQIERICRELLTDPITQEYKFEKLTPRKPFKPPVSDSRSTYIEIAYNPGVMDPWEESVTKGVNDLGVSGIKSVKTLKGYLIKPNLSKLQIKTITEKLLLNKVIQHIVDHKRPSHFLKKLPAYHFKLIEVDLLNADDKKLEKISKRGQLFLNSTEMRTIKEHFKNLKRNPSDVELETIAQTWSEHCGHKTFRGKIDYSEQLTADSRQKKKKLFIDNLLKNTVMKVTEELKKPWCVSVFKDNSGVIRFDDRYNVCFKVETHNHPSALEPYGGAGTGIGGVIRDPLGTGLGAKPVLNTDVFCFGPPDYPFSKLPKGVLHPKRIMKGVVAGVRDYGNRMGIPTANGAVLFDERFIGNPLVYCGNVGLIPKNKSTKKTKPGNLIVLIGGRTGRDGIHGATFSSGELTHESETISSGAVQIGNPIAEKKMVDVLLVARDLNLYDAITDCGGGGLSSAVGEMGQDTGARVDLEKVPLKYKGLSYTEIWISEAQERMILSIPKKFVRGLFDICKKENVEATVIGKFTNTKRLELFYNKNKVADLDMQFLHKGLPRIVRKAVFVQKRFREPTIKGIDLKDALLKILSNYNVCSKEWIIRQYDHEVQGGSILKPLVGINNDGPSDAAIAKPVLDSKRGIIISCGINPNYSQIDPYWMAASVIDEALRQIVSVGGSIDKVAILDNFCWGRTDRPEILGSLVRAAIGCYDIAKGFSVPFISGKDSLNNEYSTKEGQIISIPGTLLISAIAVMDDVWGAISMDFKQPGNLIYIIGNTFDELGGSIYYSLYGAVGNNVPRVNVKLAKKIMNALSKAINTGLVTSCHDCSEGGMSVSITEMCFAGGFGADIYLDKVPYETLNARNDFILFSESNSRFIVEVSPQNQKRFESVMKGLPTGLIGQVRGNESLKIYGKDKDLIIDAAIWELKSSWQAPLGF